MFAIEVFRTLGINQISLNILDDWKTKLGIIFNSYNKEQCITIVITIWALRFSRNKFIHMGHRDSVKSVSNFILSYKSEMESLELNLTNSAMFEDEHWTPPEQGKVKANFDVSFSQ